MGTNFYARVIPTKERKEQLKKLIDEDKFEEISDAVAEMYGHVGMYQLEGGIIHIGKRSGGWKFLWDTNWYDIDEGNYDTEQKKWIPKPGIKKWYDLNKKSISEFLHREDVRLFDEYGDEYNVDEFLKDIEEWDNTPWIDGSPKYDGKSYDEEEEKNGNVTMYRRYGDSNEAKWKARGFDASHNDFYSDGMRFATFTDFS